MKKKNLLEIHGLCLPGGINNSFTYKKFYASLLITFATGQEFADGYTKQLNASFGNNKINPSTHMLDAWNSPGDDATVSRVDHKLMWCGHGVMSFFIKQII